ncbi:unnamed protein product [Acanthosepion pharaonis]|uniref:Uncharacterized protein n=1 Tax=Acanthosepion pharaonis TaxID=158019 RepID=A0A812BTY2_ACAPH|nr:unnamed protein product [Sepia pharaonis]
MPLRHSLIPFAIGRPNSGLRPPTDRTTIVIVINQCHKLTQLVTASCSLVIDDRHDVRFISDPMALYIGGRQRLALSNDFPKINMALCHRPDLLTIHPSAEYHSPHKTPPPTSTPPHTLFFFRFLFHSSTPATPSFIYILFDFIHNFFTPPFHFSYLIFSFPLRHKYFHSFLFFLIFSPHFIFSSLLHFRNRSHLIFVLPFLVFLPFPFFIVFFFSFSITDLRSSSFYIFPPFNLSFAHSFFFHLFIHFFIFLLHFFFIFFVVVLPVISQFFLFFIHFFTFYLFLLFHSTFSPF